MHQLLQDALPYLFAFYVIDGLVMAEAGQLVLVRAWRTYRARRGGLHLAAPWPTSEAVRTYDPPLIVTAHGFHVARPAAVFPVPRMEDLTFRPFETGAKPEREGRKVFYGDTLVLSAPSEAAAAHVVELLAAVADAPGDRRMAAFEKWLKASGDAGQVRERGERYREGARARRIVAALLFALAFVVIPVGLVMGPESAGEAVEAAALGVLGLHVFSVWRTRRALRHLQHAAPGSALASMALFPPNAMHAPFVLTKDLYADLHPMAVASVLLPADAFHELARRERHRLEVVLAAADGGDTRDYWRLRLAALDRIAASAKADPKALGAPPPRVDADAAAYCPLCFTEYRRGFDACSDCGTALRALA